MKIKSIDQTCGACPSQWEGYMEDGTYIFIHYRYGYLRVDIDGQKTFDLTIGDELGGVMNTDEMLALTGLELMPGARV